MVAAFVYARTRPRARRPTRGRARSLLRDTIDEVASPLARRRVLYALVLSAAPGASWAVSAGLVCRSLGSTLSPFELVFVTAVINLGVVIPSSPGFVGTYQWLAVSALGVVGVDGAVAIAFSLLMQAVWFIPTTIFGGAIAIREVHRDATRAQAAAEPPSTIAQVKVLLVSFYFPRPAAGGVQRPLKLAQYLPALGIETHVLAPDDPQWIHRDDDLRVPTPGVGAPGALSRPERPQAGRGAARHAGRGAAGDAGAPARSPSSRAGRERLVGADGDPRRDPARARARDRRRDHDVAAELDPPVGAAVKRATGARWVADLRDSPVAHAHRRSESAAVRAKEKVDLGVAKLVARSADAIVCVADFIADEVRALEPRGERRDDPERLRLRRLRRARLHSRRAPADHAHGQLLRQARPTPFLQALHDSGRRRASPGSSATSAAPTANGPSGLDLGDRLELIPYAPRSTSLALQRDSEALLLLIPDAGGRGRGVLSGKVFEYIAARRPILAAVPPDGAAADLIRETGAGIVAAPDDVDALRDALARARPPLPERRACRTSRCPRSGAAGSRVRPASRRRPSCCGRSR